MIVPALHRPASVRPLVESLVEGTKAEMDAGWRVGITFVCSRDDLSEIRAVGATGHEALLVGVTTDEHQYPVKVNAAARASSSEWLLLAADDVRFHQHWLAHAVRAHEASGAVVIGTNDLGNQLVKRGRHATHSLVHRDYLEQGTIDEPGKLLHEGYDHNCCDVEFVETAMSRHQFVFAADSIVEHLHPLWHRQIPRDQVYAKGIRFSPADRRLLNKRRHLWRGTQDSLVRRGRLRARPRPR